MLFRWSLQRKVCNIAFGALETEAVRLHHACRILFVRMAESPTVLNVNGLQSKCNHLSKKCSSTIHCIILRCSCWPSMLSPSERFPFQISVCLSRFLNWITRAVHRTFPWCNNSCETGQVRVLFFLQYTTLLTHFCPPHEMCVCHNIHHEADD